MRYPTSLLALCIAGAALALSAPVAAQQWVLPRTPEGHPDFQGNWSNATITPFERPDGQEPVLSWDEVDELEGRVGSRPLTDPDRQPAVSGGRVGGSDGQGGDLSYNSVYLDRGDQVAVVNGEPRASILMNPPDGRIPSLTPAGQQRVEQAREFRSQFGAYDDPEVRPLGERCIVSFGTNAGPPMLPNGFYNNNYTIVQTADHVMIMTEMVHDVRIIRLGEPDRLPEQVRPWFGDSWGRWEGDTLVVETTNLNPSHPFRGVPTTDALKITERFNRIDEGTLIYEFTIDDPTTYTQPWGGQLPFRKFDELLYEYSCHEGNYALEGILKGARFQEGQEATN
jgi:hypothetical protein